jgi:ubiquinone/menaquinone biosynthesis C-methylase UbiE
LTSSTGLMKAYFNFAYNPVYDFVVGRLNLYRKLQEICVNKLELKDNDKVLCVGLGTGNEVAHILKASRNVSIVGVDYSHTALRKAAKKALAWGKEIEVLPMDARRLEFAGESFDKVLCVHVVDFVGEREKVAGEILRVLKEGGRFVITYPSKKEGMGMGLNILRDSISHNIDSGNHRIIAISKSLAQMLAGVVYLPLFLRPKRALSRREIEKMMTGLNTGDFQIEGYPLYNDFIVHGTK